MITRLSGLAVANIVSFLEAVPDYLVLASVCKSSETAVISYGIIRRVIVSQNGEICKNQIDLFKLIQKKRPQNMIQCLELWKCSKISGDFIKNLAVFCGNSGLKLLTLNYCTNIEESIIATLLLKHRESIQEFLWKESAQSYYCPHFINLFLNRDRCNGQVFQNIQIFDFPSLDNECEFCSLKAFNKAALKVLNIPLIKVHSEEIFELKSCFESLEELSICLHDYRAGTSFKFPHFPKLWKLELPDCNFRHSSIAFDLPSLKHLSLKNGNVPLIEGCFPKLEYLNVSFSKLSSQSLMLIISSSRFSNLKFGKFNGSLLDKECLELLKLFSPSAQIEIHSCRKLPKSLLAH